MGFESTGGDSWNGLSPGGFEFGVTGWVWGPPVPKSITFYLDNTAEVKDQYGRQIRRAVLPDGREIRFADSPPPAEEGGTIMPRPQFASHAQVLAALAAERIDWLSYEVRYRSKDGNLRVRSGLSMVEALKVQSQLVEQGNMAVLLDRTIACAGWPQLPYAELKKLPEIPPTPAEELRKIRDPELRRDALKVRREVDEVRQKELATAD